MTRRPARALWLFGLAAACRFAPPDPMVPVQSLPRAPVSHGPFEVTLTEIGIVKATASRGVSAPFWGCKVVKLVPEGTVVEEGEPVAWLDAVEMREEAEGKEMELRAMDSELAKSVEELGHERSLARLAAQDAQGKLALAREKEALARADVDRLTPLFRTGAISADELRSWEQKLTEAVHAREQADAAARRADVESTGSTGMKGAEHDGVRARHEALTRDVESQKEHLERLVVKAPLKGVVTYPAVAMRMTSKEKRKIQVGDEVAPWRPFVEIADVTGLEIRSQVPERRVLELSPGTQARVRLDAATTPIDARVARVESLAVTRADAEATAFVASAETRREKVFELKLELLGDVARLRPGMSVTVDLVTSKLPPCTQVPAAAIFEEGEQKVVFVVEGARAERRAVTLGTTSHDTVVVTDGVVAGEVVLLQDPRDATGRTS